MFNIFTTRSLKLTLVFLVALISSSASYAKDYYEVLGISRQTTQDSITKAYRKLAMKFHPDRFAGQSAETISANEKRFKEIGEAYDILSDPTKRAIYDQMGASESAQPNSFSSYRTQQDTLQDLLNSARLSSNELNTLLKSLAFHFSEIVQSEDPKLYLQYSQIMNDIGKNPKFATAEILKSLMILETTLDFTFGHNPRLNYWETAFDVRAVSRTTGRLLKLLVSQNDVNPMEVMREMSARGSDSIQVHVNGRYYWYEPKLNHDVAADLYKFAVQTKLIVNSKSLIAFIKEIAENILDDRGRESIANSFLSSQLGYTLSTLKDASDNEVLFIISNLKQMNQAIVYEELVRSGRLSKMTAEQVLEILKYARSFVNHYRENPGFGEDYTKLGEEIAARIKRANLTFSRDFQKLSPSREQAKLFVELSDFKFGRYTMARFQSNKLPERDYELVDGFPTPASITPNTLQLAGPRIGIRCNAIFK